MRAVVLAGAGGPEVLELRTVADPVPGPEEVLVRVRASALNRADVHQRMGRYPAPPGAPAHIPGLEYAGEVEACGERVSSWRRGDRVMGIVGGGGHAERLVTHERACLPIPFRLGWEEAAAVPEAFLTAYDALFERGHLGPGESVLLHAAGSGVGTAATQIAGVMGARAIALSRNPDKRRRLWGLGALAVLDPAAPGLAQAVVAAAGGEGVDMVLGLVGAGTLALDLEVLAGRGRLVVVGLLGGATAELDLGLIMRKRLTLVGTVLRSRPLEEKIALVQTFARRMLPLIASGRIRPLVDRTFALEDIASAHGVLERNESFGKVVLRVS